MADSGVVFDASFGVHALFAVVASALVVFNSLAIDVNLPFSGVFRFESGDGRRVSEEFAERDGAVLGRAA